MPDHIDHAQLTRLDDPRYRLRKPLPIEIIRCRDEILVWDDLLRRITCGRGRTLAAAQRNFERKLLEAYRHAQGIMAALGEYIEEAEDD